LVQIQRKHCCNPNGFRTPQIGRILFKDLADAVVADYRKNEKKSFKNLERMLRRHILPSFGTRRAASITTDDINNYVARRQVTGAASATINRELQVIKRAFSLAMKATPPKVLRSPHVPLLQLRNVRKGFFERNEFEAVCRFLPEPVADFATFAYITGWRSGEIKGLKLSNLFFSAGQHGEVRLEPGTTKNEEGRVFPMYSEIRALLEKRLRLSESLQAKGIDCAYVFWHEHRGEIRPTGTFKKSWATACFKAGLRTTRRVRRRKNGDIIVYKYGPNKGQPKTALKAEAWIHDFRRTAVRDLERMGIPRSVAMKMVGHKTERMHQRYNSASQKDLDVAREKLERAAMQRKNVNDSSSSNHGGQSIGTVEAESGASEAESSRNSLETNCGPIAQLVRAPGS
jgi:integrase